MRVTADATLAAVLASWTGTIGDSVYAEMYDGAIRDYLRIRPRLIYWVFTTTKDCVGYALPVDAEDVIGVEWYPEAWTDAINLTLTSDAELYRHLLTRQKAKWDHTLRLGTYKIRDRMLILTPTPLADGLPVYVTCTTGYDYDTCDYIDVPDAHFDAIAYLVLARLLERRALSEAGLPDIKQGLTTITRHHVNANAATLIATYRAKARAIIGGIDERSL